MRDILWIFCMLVLLSCTEEKRNLGGTFSLVSKGGYSLPIDTLTSSSSFLGTYQKVKLTAFFYLINEKKNSINKYDFNTKKLLSSIKLEVEGPNGVGHVSQILPCGTDSIFALSGYTYQLSLINGKGQLLKSYRLLSDDIKLNGFGMPEGGYANLPIGNNHNLIYRKGDFIYLGAYPMLNCYDQNYYEKGKSGISINIKTGEHHYLIDYPKTYLNAYQKGWRFPGQYTTSSQTFNEEKGLCVFSFPADLNIYTYDVRTKKVAKYETKSEYFDDVILTKNPRPSDEEDVEFCTKNHSYERIYYDKYRKIYLRNSIHPNPKKRNKKDGLPFMIVSVIILDENFQRIGETMLADGLGGGMMFFRPDGIYLQSISYDEDHIQFTRYELAKK